MLMTLLWDADPVTGHNAKSKVAEPVQDLQVPR